LVEEPKHFFHREKKAFSIVLWPSIKVFCSVVKKLEGADPNANAVEQENPTTPNE